MQEYLKKFERQSMHGGIEYLPIPAECGGDGLFDDICEGCAFDNVEYPERGLPYHSCMATVKTLGDCRGLIYIMSDNL